MTLNKLGKYLLNEEKILKKDNKDNSELDNRIKDKLGDGNSKVIPLSTFKDKLYQKQSKNIVLKNPEDDILQVGTRKYLEKNDDITLVCKDHKDAEAEGKPEELLDRDEKVCDRELSPGEGKEKRTVIAELRTEEWIREFLGQHDKFRYYGPTSGKFQFNKIKSIGGRTLDADVYVELVNPIKYSGGILNGFAIMPDGREYHMYNPRLDSSNPERIVKEIYNDLVRGEQGDTLVFHIVYDSFDGKVSYGRNKKKNERMIPEKDYIRMKVYNIANSIKEICDSAEKAEEIIRRQRKAIAKRSDYNFKQVDTDKISDRDKEKLKKTGELIDKQKDQHGLAALKRFLNAMKSHRSKER